MLVERHTPERAAQLQAVMRARGLAPVQGQQRRLDILKAAGLPRITGPRVVNGGVEYGNVYTWIEAVEILRHPKLCWHEREAILKYGGSLSIEERRVYWASVLTALALGLPGCVEKGCTWL